MTRYLDGHGIDLKIGMIMLALVVGLHLEIHLDRWFRRRQHRHHQLHPLIRHRLCQAREDRHSSH
jgi:hypothetical protein